LINFCIVSFIGKNLSTLGFSLACIFAASDPRDQTSPQALFTIVFLDHGSAALGMDSVFHLSSILAKSYDKNMRTTTPRTSRLLGFTLIELLVVIAVIGILAGLVLQTAGYAQKKGARSRAEAEIAALSAALENYKSDKGDYPKWTNTTTTSSGNNAFVRAELAPSTNNSTNNKIYFEFSKKMGTNSDASETNQSILDPFGNAYGYQYPGDTNRSGTNFFDLWSSGGGTNSNQWIKNW
jgi:hypothetical protein